MANDVVTIDDALVILRSLDYYISSLQNMNESLESDPNNLFLDKEIEKAKIARKKIGEIQI